MEASKFSHNEDVESATQTDFKGTAVDRKLTGLRVACLTLNGAISLPLLAGFIFFCYYKAVAAMAYQSAADFGIGISFILLAFPIFAITAIALKKPSLVLASAASYIVLAMFFPGIVVAFSGMNGARVTADAIITSFSNIILFAIICWLQFSLYYKMA
jgi:hypothetical protein